MAIGRISGPLLKANLLRNGVDLAFETDLLYLDVVNGRIGIKTDNPTHDLTVNGTTRTVNLEVTNQLDIGNVTILGNTISSNNGILNFTGPAGSLVNYQTQLQIDNINLNTNVISTTGTNTNLEIRPDQTGPLPADKGTLDIFADTNITGNLYVTGDITLDGDINIGTQDTDVIVINAEIGSNLIPNLNNTYTIGTNTPSVGFPDGKRWKDLWTNSIFADSISTDGLVVDNIQLDLRQGKIWYVATNGEDTYTGDHQNDPFATVAKALSVATAGDTVYIYPGVYTEVFPLTIPVGVSVRGESIRSVKIVPTEATKTNDAFLLNGETNVEDLTVGEFFSPGYGFKFASPFTVTTKSPYVRNVSVITRGSVTSPSDPYGFNTADAGRGAYVDGSVATITSREASMLFHSVTFITPNVDTLTATNGARVEWLNSFTYFANKGMNLISSSAGFAGQGKTRLKIPTRTGTWTVGDTVSYYDTDGTTVLASGIIDTVDANWINLIGRQVGFVIPEDRAGKTVTVVGDAKLSTAVKRFGTASLALDGVGDYLSIAPSPDFNFGTDSFTIETWVYRNNVAGNQYVVDLRTPTNTGLPLLYFAATSLVYYANGANRIIGTVSTTGTWLHIALVRNGSDNMLFVNGTQLGTTWVDATNMPQAGLTIGASYVATSPLNGYMDDFRVSKGIARYTANFTAPTAAFLGDTSSVLLLHFNGLNNSTAIVDDGVTFVDIRSSSGGTSTELLVADYSDFGAEIRSIGSASVYGNYGAYGDGVGVIAYLIGQNLAYIGNAGSDSNDPTTVIQANEVVELNGAKIYYNSVDHKGDFRVGDLFYVNQQTGEVTFANSDIEIGTSLTFSDGLGNVTFIDANKIETGDFRISGNTIETLSQDFNVLSASDQINLQSNVNIAGNLDVVGNVTIGGNIIIGDETTDTITFNAVVASDIIPKDNSVYSLGSTDYEWKYLYTSELVTGNVTINQNIITTNTVDTDLILSANGTGRIYIPTNNVEIEQDLTVNGTTSLADTNIGTGSVPATMTHIGDLEQTGNVIQVGDTNITGTYTTSGTAQFTDVRISTNEITTTIGNNDLRLLAAGTGKVVVPSNDVQIDQNLTVNGTLSSGSVNVTTSIAANAFSTGDILIDDNVIKTTLLNNDLILQAAGTGKIYVPADPVQFDQNLTVLGTTNLKTTNITGTVTHVGDYVQTGDVTQTGNTSITGTLTVGSTAQFQDIKIDNNVITTTISNNDLVLTAAGTGRVYVPSDAVQFDQTLTVIGLTTTSNIQNTGTVTSNVFTTGDINIDDNVIKTTLTNSNLVLQANGTGIVSVPSNNVQLDKNLTVVGTTTLATTNIGTVLVPATVTHVGTYTHTGDTEQTGNFTLNGVLTVNDAVQFKDIRIENNVITTTISNNDLELAAAGTGRVYVPQNNVEIDQNLTVIGTTTSSTINNSGTITSGTFSTGNITINGNTIQTTVTNSNLQLQANGTGLIELEQFQVQENEIRTSTNTDIVVAPHGTGIVNINSNQSIKIPVGTTAERPNPASAGMVRFNTTLSRYEGFDGTNWIRLDGLYDLDENTYVTAELTPGANDNTFRFVTNGVQIADLTATRLNAVQLQVDSINIDANIISTTTPNTDISFQTTGTGAVRFENFTIVNNVITNTVSNSNTVIEQTGTGYFKIGDTNGFAIPSGTTEQRPTVANTEVGMMRFNTSDFRVEVWDGIQWISAAGSQGAITVADAEDISILTVLMLG